MAFINAPDFGIKSVSWSLARPAQSNTSGWTGKRTIVANPWHGKWSAKAELAAIVGEANVRAVRSFLGRCRGSINTFRLFATEGPQNANYAVTVASTAAAGSTTMSISGATTPLLNGQFFTVNGQLCCCTADQSGSTLTFEPPLRQAASTSTTVVTSRPYALVFMTSSSLGWSVDPGQLYGVSFEVEEAILEADGTAPETSPPSPPPAPPPPPPPPPPPGVANSYVQNRGFRSFIASIAGAVDGDTAYCSEPGREGPFVWSSANLSAMVTADPNQGVYVPPAAATSGASGAWVRVLETGELNPAWFGAALNDLTDDSAAVLAAIALSKALAGNTVAPYYKGGPNVRIPAGKTAYMAGTPIDPTHGFMLCGHGSGRLGAAPSSGLRWNGTCSGIRVQNVLTSGDTTIDGAAHFGAGIFLLRGLKLSGGYSGTEGNHHAIDPKAPFDLDDVWLDNWPGEGINGKGNISSLQRNVSVSRVSNSRISQCRIAWFNQGPDANIIRGHGVELIANRQAGLVDDAGIGSDKYDSFHAAGNGIISTSGPFTQCSDGTNRYAAVWGQTPTALAANAPTSGADNSYWMLIEAGGATSTTPLHSGGGPFRAGGDYVTTATPVAELDTCYSEGGGFSQFGGNTLIINPAIAVRYMRGGVVLRANGGPLDISVGADIKGRLRLGLTSFGVIHEIGPSSGSGADAATAFNTCGSGGHKIQFNRYNSDGSFNEEIGYIWPGADGSGTVRLNARVSVPFRIGGNAVAALVASGLAFQADKGLTGGNGAAPTTGAHVQGEIVFNSSPSAGGKIGWVCVSGGSPGTWKPWGAIDA